MWQTYMLREGQTVYSEIEITRAMIDLYTSKLCAVSRKLAIVREAQSTSSHA